MDPLSITVATLALIASVNKTFEILKRGYRLPVEILGLIEETSDLALVLRHVEAVLNLPNIDSSQSAAQASDLSQLVERIKSNLLTIEEILKSHVSTKMDDSGSSVSVSKEVKVNWLASRKILSRIKDLKLTLQNTKFNLTATLGVVTAHWTACIEQGVKSFLKVSTEAGTAQQYFQRHAMNALIRQTQNIHNIRRQLRTISQKVDVYTIERSSEEDGHEVQEPIEIMEKEDVELQLSKKQALTSRVRRNRSFGRPQRKCSWGCNCSCHTRQTLATHRVLTPILGNLSIEYILPSSLSAVCDQSSCRGRSPSVLQADYLFPPWLWMALISATISAPTLRAYNITLRASRVVPDSAIVFRYAIEGNLIVIRQLFDAGTASAYDIDSTTRTSALVYATDRGHIEVWRFLLSAGADPYHETITKHSPMDVACGRILGQTVAHNLIDAFSEDFDTEEYLENREFPGLHQIVLGLKVADLDTHLGISSAEINKIDYQGRTALSWAALRGDTVSTEILLRYGADPNLTAFNGDAPLHYATRAMDPGCVAPLIAHGGDKDALNAWHVNPLSYATMNRDDIRYMEPLVEAGANLDICDKHGRTALARAVHNNRPSLVQYLLDNGAELVEADAWGVHPLMTAIQNKFLAVSRVIIENGKRELTTSEMMEALKAASSAGDAQTITILEKRMMMSCEKDTQIPRFHFEETVLNEKPRFEAVREENVQSTTESSRSSHDQVQDAWQESSPFLSPQPALLAPPRIYSEDRSNGTRSRGRSTSVRSHEAFEPCILARRSRTKVSGPIRRTEYKVRGAT